MPAPTDVAGVKRVLGLVQYLAKFIPNLSDVSARCSSVERFLVDRDQWLMVRFNNYSTSVNIVVKFLTTVKNS
jgi:hypothetical protein